MLKNGDLLVMGGLITADIVSSAEGSAAMFRGGVTLAAFSSVRKLEILANGKRSKHTRRTTKLAGSRVLPAAHPGNEGIRLAFEYVERDCAGRENHGVKMLERAFIAQGSPRPL